MRPESSLSNERRHVRDSVAPRANSGLGAKAGRLHIVIFASAAVEIVLMPKKPVAESSRKSKPNKRTRIKGSVMAKSAWIKLPLARPDDDSNELAKLSARKGRRRVLPNKS